MAVLILSSLAALIALTRAGIRSFWLPLERDMPQVGVVEIAPVLGLLLACATMTVQAGPIMHYMEATARSLHAPVAYIGSVTASPTGGEGDP